MNCTATPAASTVGALLIVCEVLGLRVNVLTMPAEVMVTIWPVPGDAGMVNV